MHRAPMPARPIAIIGVAGRFPGASDVEQYWRNLVDGIESLTHSDRAASEAPIGASRTERYVAAVGHLQEADCFDADHFRIPPAEAVLLDPQHRVLLEVAAEALQDAGYAGPRDAVVGVFVGCGENVYHRDLIDPFRPAGAHDVRVALASEKDFLAPRLAFKLGLSGPAVTVQTGCATSLTAIALACSALAAGDCDIALAGGVSLLRPDVEGYTYSEGGIYSADGHCRTFDAAASGSVPASGAGIVVLRRDEDARAERDHRRAVIRGWAVNNDGGSRAGFTVPNIQGQEGVIRAALARAGIGPDEVGYIEAHGTGTAIGDPVEFEALRRVFVNSDRPAASLTLGAVKPNIGHTDAAAGVAGIIKATFIVQRAVIPGTLHFRSPNPEINLDATPFVITAETRHWTGNGPRIAGVNSFGLGGSNAHVIVESVSPRPAASSERARQVLCLSARSPEELRRQRERLAQRLAQVREADAGWFADVAYTLAVGRATHRHRWTTVAATPAEAAMRLRDAGGEARPISRWSLRINGSPDDLESLGERLRAAEPGWQRMWTDLAEHADPGSRDRVHRAAVAALATACLLRRLGMRFARVDAPEWLHPAAQWFSDASSFGTLTAAIAACDWAKGTNAPSAPRRPGQVVVDAAFDPADVLAEAWQSGVAIDWAEHFRGEARGRIPLPTYPFTRRRFWIDRPHPAKHRPEDTAQAPRRGGTADVAAIVTEVWCEVLGMDQVAPDAHFVDDLAGDSLYAVEIGARLIERLGIDLPMDLPFVAPTVAATVRLIHQTVASEETAA
jgi:phthiocerol/phenolphthiocerol synthesis type-I polyketide synthase E